jgi:hypothetical protein
MDEEVMTVLNTLNCYKGGLGPDKQDAMKLHDGTPWSRETVGSIERANNETNAGTSGGKRTVNNRHHWSNPAPTLAERDHE